jgi:hypothetical protein
MRKLRCIKTMKILTPRFLLSAGPRRAWPKLVAALLLTGLAVPAPAQQLPTDPPARDKKMDGSDPNPPAPPADALPSGDPKSGVLKPPDVDPKMAKRVPDVDPAMDNPPPGKIPPSGEQSPPKIQPR